MKKSSAKRAIIPLLLGTMLFSVSLVFGAENVINGDAAVELQVAAAEDPQIALFLKNTRSSSTRHLYSDIYSVLKRNQLITKISVLAHGKLDESAFQRYDLVLVVSEKRLDTLDPGISGFVQKHADNPKLMVLAFLPRGKSELSAPPEGVDVLTSASRERPAKKLINNVAGPEILERLMQNSKEEGKKS